ncbi:hypothetical protein SAMN06295885_3063 [Rathayibacter oskolensis]|uniref:Uncharacterized protein n=1 Tax=Rathayibacter oskolensis TaxID=1891671 RepID=A0A1X7PD81_9MICO|nr:hypothetical protein [Rathayibacter oskolensis]SMH48553.1 hypothetical protein SAMN06295885_3063 [Rathayibacter oskolensis]
MPPEAQEAVLPVTALVFPLLVGLVLTAGGAAALLAREPVSAEGPHDPIRELLPWLRIGTGVALLLSVGTAFAIAAILAVVLCSDGLRSALESFSRAAAPAPTESIRVAGASALLTFAVIGALEGLLGFDGIASHLARFDLRDLSWAAALVSVLTITILLQAGASEPSATRTRRDRSVPEPADPLGARRTW